MVVLHRVCALVVLGLALLLPARVVAQNKISAKSPGGDRVASASEKTIEVTDLKTGRLLMKMKSEADVVTLLYAPGQQKSMLASLDKDSKVSMYDGATGKLLWRSKALQGANVLSFSPDGAKVTAKAPGGATTFSLATGNKVD